MAQATIHHILLTAKDVAAHIIQDNPKTNRPVLKFAKKMCKESNEIDQLARLIDILQITRGNARATYMEISKLTLINKINWGRITAILQFSKRFAEKLQDENLPDLEKEIPKWFKEFTNQYLLVWIQQNGGWKNYEESFGNHPSKWNTILTFSIISIFCIILLRLLKTY